ncbi:MAG: TlyA family RNA methyltransferase [Deltaproteobacteria bacterium]|jgi:23S rRNA (cytidine1920-2'-O)/16S rRNA (cytidine1409-2'-O)-methyltransferase|nr:TlyA family RNA methyltransferase [Deltaproteobacteria bacterium]
MAKCNKIRADELLVNSGLVESKNKAQALIMAGRVTTDKGREIKKAGEMVPIECQLLVKEGSLFVSRGGFKLQGALQDLKVDPQDLICLDLGASTGGFTDCLLKNGAAHVTAVDVGKGLIDQSLRICPKVTLLENQNARYLGKLDLIFDLKGPFDLAVMDLSFISLSLILPVCAPLIKDRGKMIAMVKPQFEVGKGKTKRGVVKDPALIEEAALKISAIAPILNPPFKVTGKAPSKLAGPKGNREIFVLMERL